MFPPSTYAERRRDLIATDLLQEGLVLLLGNNQSAMNYADNPYPFRQDSTFLYYFGLDVPGLDAVIDLDSGQSHLYGDDPTLDDVIWIGDRPSVREYADRADVETTFPHSALEAHLRAAQEKGRSIHALPPYRASHYRRLDTLLDNLSEPTEDIVSTSLVQSVVRQRSVKSEAEVQQLEEALDITAEMHESAMQGARPGIREQTIAGRMTGIANAQGQGLSFRPTCSVHGEILHNHVYSNEMTNRDLLLVDAGAESPFHYAGDITRVTPVGGSFSTRQRALYEAVLDAQTSAIHATEPDVSFRHIHLHSARVLTEHLMDIGLMQGDVDEAVAAGAHALFFPHGLGHMLGLDTHDMENLGEDHVGYADDQSRSEQFGLHALRLARPLKPGFVLTVEPGCYFIPELIRQWRSEGRHAAFIDYDTVSDFDDVGGIRIEDDVLVTEDGARILGPNLAKTVAEVEEKAGTGPFEP